MVEMVYTTDLKSAGPRPCRFDSDQRHQLTPAVRDYMWGKVRYRVHDKRFSHFEAVQLAAQVTVKNLELMCDWQVLADAYWGWFLNKEERAYARFRLSRCDNHIGLE